jgi:hypothetical protein
MLDQPEFPCHSPLPQALPRRLEGQRRPIRIPGRAQDDRLPGGVGQEMHFIGMEPTRERVLVGWSIHVVQAS